MSPTDIDYTKTKPKYYNDDKTKLICQYCLKEMKSIAPAHLKHHDMTMVEYKERFPDAPVRLKSSSRKSKKNKEDVKQKKKTAKVVEQNDNTIILKVRKNNSHNIKVEKTEETTKLENIFPSTKTDSKNILIHQKDKLFSIIKNIFPAIKKNYIFKKVNRDGHILYTIITDFASPEDKLMIDFGELNWNVRTPLLTKYRKKVLLEESHWRYLNIECKDGIEESELIKILKNI